MCLSFVLLVTLTFKVKTVHFHTDPIHFLAPPTSLLELRRKGNARFIDGIRHACATSFFPRCRSGLYHPQTTMLGNKCCQNFCNLHMGELSGIASLKFHAIYIQLPRLARCGLLMEVIRLGGASGSPLS